jgi:hypothetical protein
MATVAAEFRVERRKRESIPLRPFGFWSEYQRHDTFRVSIIGRGEREPFVYDVRSFGNMTVSVRSFAECAGMAGEATRGMADIYRTGYGMVNGFNVRVTPIA